MSDTLIVSVSGLRGIVGGSLTPEVAARYVLAFIDGLPPGPVVVGRDGRPHGPLLARAIGACLAAAGRDILDAGVAATPTIGILVRDLGAAGGIQISASHNPAPYNGLKLFSAAGRVINAAEGQAVLERFRAGRAPATAPPTAGVRREVDGTARHVTLVLATVDAAAIRRTRPRVWLDAGHGAGSRVGRALLEALECDAEIVGGEPDGLFEHPPEPTAANLAAWLPRVAAAGADVGFFQDPDADRLAVATADGTYIGEECTLALAAQNVLARHPGPVVVNCSSSAMTAAIAARHGAPCRVSAVGEANVVDAMLAERAVLGGEGNGGVIHPDVVLVRDSAVAMALVLDSMCRGGRVVPVAELAAGLPGMAMEKERIDLDPAAGTSGLAAALERVERAFPEARGDRLDGLRLDWPGGWLLVRASNTEPIVRVVAEAASAEEARTAIARAREALAAPGNRG